jgi:hypothetical protein
MVVRITEGCRYNVSNVIISSSSITSSSSVKSLRLQVACLQ